MFWEQSKATILIAREFVTAWQEHLVVQGKMRDITSSKNPLSKFRPHVIFIGSAAGCRVPCAEECTGIKSTVKSFWTAAAPFVAQFLSLWLQLQQACYGAELTRNAVAHIRASWPAWQNLGNDD